MKSWSFSIALLMAYLLTFQLWREFPARSTYLVVGGIAVVLMAVGMRRAAQHGYFTDRRDLILHGLVIVDVALESVSFELFDPVARCILCAPADARHFHDSFNFCGCAAAFAVLVGGYHAWSLRAGRRAPQPAPGLNQRV